ncbi:MAG: hypothetical protein K2L81_04845, partial [Muribaculaceae bacterium]|nr:hypothetical protein [Muribaculaceae bacterium]
FIALIIVGATVTAVAYLLNLLFHQNWFSGWQEFVVVGLAGAMGGVFGPILSAWLTQKFKKRH